MSGRAAPSKKLRRLSTDSEEEDDGYSVAIPPVRSQARTAPKSEPTRARRTASATTGTVSTFASNSASSSGVSASLSRGQMRLTVKASSSKLRKVTRAPTGKTVESGRDAVLGGEILEGKRSRNVKKSYVLESDSEEEDDEMVDVDDEEEEDDEDTEGEEDGDGDDVDALPPPQRTPAANSIKKSARAAAGSTNTISLKIPAVKGSIAQQTQVQQQDASDDDELSELESDLGGGEGEEDEDEEVTQMADEEDAEGEEEMEVEAGEEDDDVDSNDDETPMDGSRASTPDLNKLTKRQRARFDDGGSGYLMALPDEVQVKKHLTAEEYAMRRAEMARRRKNLSEKRNEEEKIETINKLLKKQAPKTNARRRDLNAANGSDDADVDKACKPDALFVRWVSNKDGNKLAIPEEWLDGPVGVVFGGGRHNNLDGKLIHEVS